MIQHPAPTCSNLERIDSTLEPYSGRFLIYGGEMEVFEGAWPGAVVMIEFPGMTEAKSWYRSPAYQEILPLCSACAMPTAPCRTCSTSSASCATTTPPSPPTTLSGSSSANSARFTIVPRVVRSVRP